MKKIEDKDMIEVVDYDFWSQKEMEIVNEAFELKLVGKCYQLCYYDTGECIDYDYDYDFFWCITERGITFKSIEDAKHFIEDNDLRQCLFIQTYFMHDNDIFLDDFEFLEPLIRMCKINDIINS